jgi:hypothetical protein
MPYTTIVVLVSRLSYLRQVCPNPLHGGCEGELGKERKRAGRAGRREV